MTGLTEQWAQLEARRRQREHNREHNRVRIIVTSVNQPEEEAETFYITAKRTARLAKLLEGALRNTWGRAAVIPASPNCLPQHGAQLRIEETAWDALGEDWRAVLDPQEDRTWGREYVEAALQDLIQRASGGMLFPLVQWAGGSQ
jgi:hypothetical protein